MIRRWPALGVALLAAASAACIWAGASGPPRAVSGLLLVCVLPGAAIVGALGLRRAPLEAVVLAGAVSLALAALAGVAAAAAHAGLDARTTAALLAGVTVAASALWLAGVGTGSGPVQAEVRVPWRAAPGGALLGVLVAVAGAGAAIAVAHRDAVARDRATPVSELWIAGARSHALLEVGVRNGTRHRGTYNLTVQWERCLARRTLVLAAGKQRVVRFRYAARAGQTVVVELRRGSAGPLQLREVLP